MSWVVLALLVASLATCSRRSQAIRTGLDMARLSKWGTLQSPTYSPFLSENFVSEAPWGSLSKTGGSSDEVPDTGVTRFYDFTVSRESISPDGYTRDVLLVNGQFPGPAIQANWGDWIELTVHNNITEPADGTTIHLHGLRQYRSQYFDGVPGISQCHIAPGASLTYRVRADMYGSSWWHSHYSAQYTAGQFGPLIIYGPSFVAYDIDVGPVMLGDWYHRNYSDVLADAAGSSPDFSVYVPSSDNSLINGKNPFNCSSVPSSTSVTQICSDNAPRAIFRFERGKTHRLRLMNTGAAAMVNFSIDGHKLIVIANDFTPLKPYEVDYVSLAVGQRADVLVKAIDNPEETYWMRSTIALNCSAAKNIFGTAIVTYDPTNVSLPATNLSSAAALADKQSTLCQNDPLSITSPVCPQPAASEPSTTTTVAINLTTNATGHHVWILNNVTQYTDYNAPLLRLAAKGENTSYPLGASANVYAFGANKTVRIVLNSYYQSAHPMHLHGHQFAVLSMAPYESWNGTLTNLDNPLRRDTAFLPLNGNLVIQFETDNPGAWPFHCHIAWHVSMGFSLSVLEGEQALDRDEIISKTDEGCRAWNAWTAENVVEQGDSGI